MKKIIGILLACCLLLMSGAALAEEEAVWKCYDEDCIYVEGTLRGDVIIPDNINGIPSYALMTGALDSQNEITSLTFPKGMYTLQDNSVTQMEKVQSITLNDDLEVIGANNFQSCPSLTSVTVPASVRMIGSAFMQCDNLKEIRFLGECPVFVDTAFCFFWMPDEYVIYVPDDQYDAYAAALQDANGAVDHLQPSGQNALPRETVNNEDWFVFDASTGAITGYREYHPFVEIPQTIGGVEVKSIAEGCMHGDLALFALVIPEGVERVEAGAFQSSFDLNYIKFPSTLKYIGEDAFNYTGCERIEWSEGLEEIGARAFMDTRTTTLALPSTVKTIGESAFESTWLQELHLSGNLESIGARAFADCSLSYMAFDFYTPIQIADDAFSGNPLADLDLPWDSSFENRAQYAEILRDQCPDCTVWINNPENAGVAEHPTNDASISLFENGVLTMYKGDQPNLTVWTHYNDIEVTALGDGVFKGNQTIQSFYPHHCGWFTTIGNEAFADSSIEYVEPFGSITTIGSGAFRNCLNLKTLTLPASLTSIGEDALAGCDNLEELIVLCDPAILPDGLLDECSTHTRIYAAADATDEQVRVLSAKANQPWYAPLSRLGEEKHELIEMPYAMLPMDDFWYDTEYARLDRYHGYELNLYLPREAEGMTLNALGGDMLGRARAGDNYELELPVRSVVIPENYTENYSAFMGCETLETVICYAPMEETAAMFEGCTNLREVIFVNGVRSLGRGIFYGCENLETVYVGPYVEEVNEEAFIGCPNFDLSKCITDPALMPDVDALLAAVKSDPIPAPTPEPTAVPAMPIGEEGAPYFGTWQIETVEMEGEVYSAEDIGSDMSFTLNADGTAETDDGAAAWMLVDGAVVMDEMSMTMNAEGKLVMEADGMKWIFGKLGGAEAPSAETTPAPAAAPAGEASAYIGKWYAEILEMEGEAYPVAEMGMEMSFILNADGTAESFDGETTETGTWTIENGAIMIGGEIEGMVPMTANEEGKLVMEEDGMKLIFAKAEGAAAPAAEPAAAPAAEPAAEPAAAASGDASAFVGKWNADTLEMDGEVYPVGMMGMEMYFILNADGTAEYYDGEVSETASWVFENGAVVIDGLAIQVTEDGRLLMEDEDSNLFFAKEGAAAPAAEPAVEPVEPAEPTGDASAYIGKWNAETVEMDGVAYPADVLGVEMTFTVNADGTAESYDGETSGIGVWTLEDGVLMLEGMPMTFNEEGKLVMEADGMKLIFAKAEGAAAPAVEPAAEPAAPAAESDTGFIGTWYGCYMATGVMNGDPRDLFEINLTVNADGSANLAYPTDEAWHWTENADGSLTLTKDSDGTEMPLYMLDESYICFGSMDGDGNAFGGYIVFSRDASGEWTPEDLKAAETPVEAEASMDVSADLSERMEVRYVCQSAESGGVTMDASLLGGEYALTFHANGTVDFVMVGNTIPGMKWTQGDNSFIIDYYGTLLEAVLTEAGLDLNYFDTMLMHFVPAN